MGSNPEVIFSPQSAFEFSCPVYSTEKSGTEEKLLFEFQNKVHQQLKSAIEVTCVFEESCTISQDDVDEMIANLTAEPL